MGVLQQIRFVLEQILSLLEPIREELLLFGPLGLAVLAILFWRGFLSRNALDQGPVRRTGLGPSDLIMGLGLMFVGLAASPFLMKLAGLEIGGAGEELSLTAGDHGVAILLSQALTQLPPVIYLLWRVKSQRHGLTELGVRPRRPFRDVLWSLIALMAVIPLCMASTVITVALGLVLGGDPPPPVGHETLNQIQSASSNEQKMAFGILLASAILVAPLLEELIFRGLIQTCMLAILGQARRWPAVWVTAGMFTLIHAGPGVQWQGLSGLFVLAVALGWLYERTGSLLAPMLVHVGFNSINTAWVIWGMDSGG